MPAHESVSPEQFGLVRGPTLGKQEGYRSLPRLPGGETPTTLYRVASEGEWKDAQETGVVRSWAGRLHASAQPEPGWANEPHEPHHMMEIAYSDDDPWSHKETLAHGYATIPELPLDRVRKVRSYPNKRALIEGER